MSDETTKKPDKADVKPEKPEKATLEKDAGAGKEQAAAASALETDEKEKAERVDPQQLKAAKKEKKTKAQETVEPAQAGGKGAPQKGKKQAAQKGKAAKKEEAQPFVKRTAVPRLMSKYRSEVLPALMKEFGYKTPMAAPRLVKITLNMGLGEALQNAKLLDSAEQELAAIAGQRPVITRARKSIATFKLRQGQKIGAMVTLRRERMYEFFDRLVTFALPRTRDFKGISPRSFDGRGNFSLGIREQIVFSEIDYDKIEKIMGLNVCIVTTARTDEEGRALLRHLGMPFRGQ